MALGTEGDRCVVWGAGSETAGGKADLGDFMGRVRVYFILNAMTKKFTPCLEI